MASGFGAPSGDGDDRTAGRGLGLTDEIRASDRLRPDRRGASGKRILFLQGPHGPFFHELSRHLLAAGAQVWKVGFNQGDRAFWKDDASFIPYRGRHDDWPAALAGLLDRHRITDIALYGDTRPIHAQALRIARARGLVVHCFEEGYLRPYWATYERNGVNGHSRLTEIPVAQMRDALAGQQAPMHEAPAVWGDMRQHAFYGALYHGHVLFRNRGYPHWQPHRETGVAEEFALHARRFLAIPRHAAERWLATRRIRKGGFPFHLALLQLGHDSSIRYHSPFANMPEFMEEVVAGFARGAPGHHHLVFKAHPLEDNRFPLRRITLDLARRHGLQGRVHFVRGGKLAALLDMARTAVTINSTAAQQALWRGLPVKAFGQSVYSKPELVSDQPLPRFFAAPRRPDAAAYRAYRQFLLATSQVPGGYYSARGRRRLTQLVVDMMLDPLDPYDRLLSGGTEDWQRLRAVI